VVVALRHIWGAANQILITFGQRAPQSLAGYLRVEASQLGQPNLPRILSNWLEHNSRVEV